MSKNTQASKATSQIQVKRGLNRPTFAGKNSTQLAMKVRDLVEDEEGGQTAKRFTAAWPDGSDYKGFLLVSTIRDPEFEKYMVEQAAAWLTKHGYDKTQPIVEAKAVA